MTTYKTQHAQEPIEEVVWKRPTKIETSKAGTRQTILNQAAQMVSGDRQDDYGTPENIFQTIANLWNAYLSASRSAAPSRLTPVDVAAMMALLKIARVASGHGKTDNWIDLAGYAACGGEIEGAK